MPFTGAVYLVGILLPAVNQTERPAGYGPGSFTSGVGFVPFDDPNIAGPGGLNLASRNGTPDADGDLIGPIDSVDPASGAGGFTARSFRSSSTRPSGPLARRTLRSGCQPTRRPDGHRDHRSRGNIIALHRMPDATIFSVDIAITKARNTTYCNANSLADYGDGLVSGTAGRYRPAGHRDHLPDPRVLGQPFFPPGIDGTDPGPLFDTVQANRNPDNFDDLAFSVDQGEIHSGLIVFPGSAPLYRDGMLVGGSAFRATGSSRTTSSRTRASRKPSASSDSTSNLRARSGWTTSSSRASDSPTSSSRRTRAVDGGGAASGGSAFKRR